MFESGRRRGGASAGRRCRGTRSAPPADPDVEVPVVGRDRWRDRSHRPARRLAGGSEWRPGVVTQLCTARAENVSGASAGTGTSRRLPTAGVLASRRPCRHPAIRLPALVHAVQLAVDRDAVVARARAPPAATASACALPPIVAVQEDDEVGDRWSVCAKPRLRVPRHRRDDPGWTLIRSSSERMRSRCRRCRPWIHRRTTTSSQDSNDWARTLSRTSEQVRSPLYVGMTIDTRGASMCPSPPEPIVMT